MDTLKLQIDYVVYEGIVYLSKKYLVIMFVVVLGLIMFLESDLYFSDGGFALVVTVSAWTFVVILLPMLGFATLKTVSITNTELNHVYVRKRFGEDNYKAVIGVLERNTPMGYDSFLIKHKQFKDVMGGLEPAIMLKII